ncbi:MAG: cyclic nucleotide-binding domain-containing protein [Candidatus Lustribacter sp.]|jgi:glutaminase
MARFFDYPDGSVVADEPAFLAGATSADWQTIVRNLNAERFAAGQVLIAAGDDADSFCILAEGRVQVLARSVFGLKRVVATIEPGSIFGEIAFLDGGRRTATVRAVSAGAMIRITHENFSRLQVTNPALAQRIALDLGRICAARLRKTLKLIGR